ncbi:MAG: hypothetical protein AAF500_07460 [Myxococcota bacterium]
MSSINRSIFVAVLALSVAACGGVTTGTGGTGGGGTGGTGGTGTGGTGATGTGGTGATGTGGTGGTATGGTGGSTDAPFVSLTATPVSVDTGTKALLEWEVRNADSCSPSWGVDVLPQPGQDEIPINEAQSFTLTCSSGDATADDSVMVTLSSSPILVSIDMNIYLVQAGDNFDVAITVTNPGSQTIEDAELELEIPDNVEVDPADFPPGACSGGNCDPGEMITVTLGDLLGGTVQVISFTPTLDADATDVTVVFEPVVSAPGEMDAMAEETVNEGESDLEIALLQTPEVPEAGGDIMYTVTYDNNGGGSLIDVAPTLTLPILVDSSEAVVSDGGTVDDDGVVTWPAEDLTAGAMRILEVTVPAEEPLPSGLLLRAEAGATIDGADALVRVTSESPVFEQGEDCTVDAMCPMDEICELGICVAPIRMNLDADYSPVVVGDFLRVSGTITNQSQTRTANDVTASIRLPAGVFGINERRASDGAACTAGLGSSCDANETVSWNIGNLAPGESRIVSIEPFIESGGPVSMTFTGMATSTNGFAASGSTTTVDVVTTRALNLQLVERNNPMVVGGELSYSLHYSNPSPSTEDVVVSFTLPEGASVTEADGGTESGGTITWPLQTLASLDNAVRHVTIEAPDAAVGDQLLGAAAIEVAGDPAVRAEAKVRTVVASQGLDVVVDANPDPIGVGDVGRVAVTVTNPTASIIRDVGVEARLPNGIFGVQAERASAGADCGIQGLSSSCDAGENLDWAIGDLGPGETRVVSLEPFITNEVDVGFLQVYEVDVRSDSADAGTVAEQPSIQSAAVMAISEDERPFVFHVAESVNPVVPGQPLTYTLSYATDPDGSTVDADVALSLPTNVQVLDEDGGTLSGETITWRETLQPGENNKRRVTIMPMGRSNGDQIRAEATISIVGTNDESRATIQTAVGTRPLDIAVEAGPDPSPVSRIHTVSVVVTNPTQEEARDVELELRLPVGLFGVAVHRASEGGRCVSTGFGSTCDGGQNIEWSLGNIGPEERRVTSIEVFPWPSEGAFEQRILYYEAELRTDSASEPEAVEQPAVIAADTVALYDVNTDRIDDPGLRLRMVGASNPLEEGEAQVFSLHYSNVTASTIDANLSMAFPSDATVLDSDGGTASSGRIDWDTESLAAEENNERRVMLSFPGASDGDQIRVDAAVTDDDNPQAEVRVAAVTPVGPRSLLVSMETNRDPWVFGEGMNVSIVLSNPTSTEARDVRVESRLPDGLFGIRASTSSIGAVCESAGLGSTCAQGQDLIWEIPSIASGESRVLSFEPFLFVASETTEGDLIPFKTEVRTDAFDPSDIAEQPSILAGITSAESAPDPLELRVARNVTPAAEGEAVTYALYFSNRGTSTTDADLILRFSEDATVVDSDGGDESSGMIVWEEETLVGQSGSSKEVTLRVNSAAAGEQLLAEAVLVDRSNAQRQARTVLRTPVVSSPTLRTTVTSAVQAAERGEQFRVTYNVTNTSESAVNDIVLEARLPLFITGIAATRATAGATCQIGNSDSTLGSTCDDFENVIFDVGTLAAGASTGVDLWIEPIVESGQATPLGFLMYYEAETQVAGVPVDLGSTVVRIEPTP